METVADPEETLCLAIVAIGFGDGLQERNGMLTEQSQFVLEACAEVDVGILLVGHNPSVFSASHGWPAGKGIGGSGGTELGIAHHATDEAVVGGAVVGAIVVLGHGESGDVDAEEGIGGDASRKLRIETVDAFHDEDGLGGETQALPAEQALAGGEVVAWQFYLLALKELVEVLLEEVDVDGIEALEVVVAFLVEGCLVAIHVVVVQGDAEGFKPLLLESPAEFLAEGGLAAGGGTSDEHGLYMRPVGDGLGDELDAPILERLGDFHHSFGSTLVDGAVHHANGDADGLEALGEEVASLDATDKVLDGLVKRLA